MPLGGRAQVTRAKSGVGREDMSRDIDRSVVVRTCVNVRTETGKRLQLKQQSSGLWFYCAPLRTAEDLKGANSCPAMAAHRQ